MVPRRAGARSVARTTRPTSSASVALARGAGLADLQPRPHLRRRGRVARRLGTHPRRGVGARPDPTCRAYGLTVEAGTALAADPTRHPDDDDQADKYLARRRRASPRPVSAWYEISQLGAPGPRVPAQPALLGAGRLPRRSGAPRTAHRAGARWWNLRTPERYIDAVDARRVDRGAAVRCSMPPTRRHELLQLALRTAAGVDAAALPLGRDGASRASSSGGAIGRCSPFPVACSRTRSHSDSSERPAPGAGAGIGARVHDQGGPGGAVTDGQVPPPAGGRSAGRGGPDPVRRPRRGGRHCGR